MCNFYDKSKMGLFSLGYIENITSSINELRNISRDTVDEKTLCAYIQNEINNDHIQFYRYQDGNLKSIAAYDDNLTFLKVVQIGYTEKNGIKLLAYFNRDRYGNWIGGHFLTERNIYNKFNSYRIGFISFRTYKEANDFIVRLESMLLPGETWTFHSSIAAYYRQKTQFPILESYIQQIFSKLFLEYDDNTSKNYGKIIFSTDNNYCIFNTGLLSKYAKDICIVGEVYRNKSKRIVSIYNPQVIDSKAILTTKYNFERSKITEWPPVVEFFNTVNDIIYDTSMEIDMTEDKLNHIIEEGISRNRFPEKYKDLLKNGDLPRIFSDLEQGINNALIIAARNYKYVVPQYRPQIEQKPGKIQFLMPIYLDRDYKKMPDFALVLNEEGEFYVPETVLELSWAYNNARVICKPDDLWLKPDEIIETVSMDVDNIEED